jgi:hypothetical protein
MKILNVLVFNGNQTFGRQFNEASMQNEDFGKELTLKVLFRGE